MRKRNIDLGDSGERSNIPILNAAHRKNRKRSNSDLTLPLLLLAVLIVVGVVKHSSRTSSHQVLGSDNINSVPMTPVKNVLPLQPERDLRHYEPFTFVSGSSEYDTAYNIAKQEIDDNTVNGKFIAGSGWDTLWTRDTSYAVELGAGILRPDAALQSLKQCQENDQGNVVWIQDSCMNIGRWPNLSDSIVGAQAAWHLYLLNGDKEFLGWAFSMTKNTLFRAERDVWNSKAGLFQGCSSFMESNSGYPAKYKNKGSLVGRTKALSTNMLYYSGYKLGAAMAQELGHDEEEVLSLEKKASELKNAIRSRMWLPKEGYYSYVEDENNELFTQMEGLGESLVLMAPDFENDQSRIDSMFEKTTMLDYGIPSLWPQFQLSSAPEFWEYYHNGRYWPFVQGYWGIAAARHKKESVFEKALSGLLRLSQKHDTFAEFYELDGTMLPDRKRQLWSDAGFIGMVLYGLFGMEFTLQGVQFHPVKPSTLPIGDTISLHQIKYRDMVLDLYISGSGTILESFLLDQEPADAFISNAIAGYHRVDMVLKES